MRHWRLCLALVFPVAVIVSYFAMAAVVFGPDPYAGASPVASCVVTGSDGSSGGVVG